MTNTNIQNNNGIYARLIEDDIYEYSNILFKRIKDKYGRFSNAPEELQLIWKKLNKVWSEIDDICESIEEPVNENLITETIVTY